MNHDVNIRVLGKQLDVIGKIDVHQNDTITWTSENHPHTGRFTGESATDLSSWSGGANQPVVATVTAGPGDYPCEIKVTLNPSELTATPHVIVT